MFNLHPYDQVVPTVSTSLTRRWLLAALLLLLAGWQLITLAAPGLVHAASITVTTTADVVANDGQCSLREAITSANTDTPSGPSASECAAGNGADVITLPAGTYTLSLAGSGEESNATGDLDITDEVTIIGAGADSTIINANGIDRVFHIFSGAATQLESLTVQGGSAAGTNGGGIHFDAPLTLNNSTVRNNSASTGGGLYSTGAGVLTMANSTLSNNSASCCGAGGELHANASIINSTVSTNSAGDNGGGFRFFDSTVSITNTTFANNTASLFASVWRVLGGSVTMGNSIIVASGSNPCSVTTSNGYNITNLSGSNLCANSLTATTDITNTNPNLAPLGDYGGDTQTHALNAGSPALDQIPNGVNGCGTTITTDQRGIARPQGSACDIGAFEKEPAPGYSIYLPLVIKPHPVDITQWYRLTNEFTGPGRSLAIVANGPFDTTDPIMQDTADVAGQYWKLTPLGNGYYRLTNRALGDGKAMDLPSDEENVQPVMRDTANVSGQFWKLTDLDNDLFRLTTLFLGDGKSLDMPNLGSNEQPEMRDSGNFSGQYWTLTPLGPIEP